MMMMPDDAAPIIKRGETRDIVKVKKEEHSYKYNPVKDEDTGEENDDTISSVVLVSYFPKLPVDYQVETYLETSANH